MNFKSTYLSALEYQVRNWEKQKLLYDKQEMKKILETAILDSQQAKLNHNKWVI